MIVKSCSIGLVEIRMLNVWFRMLQARCRGSWDHDPLIRCFHGGPGSGENPCSVHLFADHPCCIVRNLNPLATLLRLDAPIDEHDTVHQAFSGQPFHVISL